MVASRERNITAGKEPREQEGILEQEVLQETEICMDVTIVIIMMIYKKAARLHTHMYNTLRDMLKISRLCTGRKRLEK